MRPSLVGKRIRLQPGSGMTSQPRHKTTSASLRTTLEFPVCTQNNKHIIVLICSMHDFHQVVLFQISEIVFSNMHGHDFDSLLTFLIVLYVSVSLCSQVGRCWKVQRVHDPDVLKGNLYVHLMVDSVCIMWHRFITRNLNHLHQ